MKIKPVHRRETSLSRGWRFAVDPQDQGESLGWHAVGLDTGDWRKVTLPHSWNNMAAHADYEGIAWYRLSFRGPARANEACVHLKFAAVFYLARLWLNGTYLGEHEGGYTPFEFDVSALIRPGAENILAVRVDNCRATDRLPAHLFEGRSYGWKNCGGIVRDVKLAITSQVYLDSLRLVAVPHLTGIDQADLASLSARVYIHNTSTERFSGNVHLTIQEQGSQQVVTMAVRPVSILPGKRASLPAEISFKNPRLWHFDHPHLYSCATSVQDQNGIEYDRTVTTFGVREIKSSECQFRLNGEPVRLAGLSRHANVPGSYLAESIPVMTRDFDDLKALNMVFGRPVHYPQHEFIYDYCDRKGILLSPELPAWQLTAGQMADKRLRRLAKQQLAEMVAAAYNHPCIWAWSVGNELESNTVAGREFVRDMVDYVKSLDPTRPVGFASYHLLVGRPWADATRYTDFVMMNQYFGTWHGPRHSLDPALDTIHLTWPDKLVVISEFGFSPHWQQVEGPAVIDPEEYYYIPGDASADSVEADEQRQRVIKDQMAVYRSKPFVAASVFWDYRGRMGVVDEHGYPRPSWHILQEEFAPILIDRVDATLQEKDQYRLDVVLRARGPIEVDLPAYTLRDYRLTWEYLSSSGKPLNLSGEAFLPELSPGTIFNLSLNVPRLAQQSKLRISVFRPTGFLVISRDITL